MSGSGGRAHHVTGGRGSALIGAACALALLVLAPAAGAVTFGSPQTVAPASESPLLSGGNSSLAMDASGDAVVVWTNGSSSRVRAAFRSPGGAFGVPVNVSAAGNAQGDARVAMDAAGDTIVAWTESTGSAEPEWNTVASIRPAGGTFSSPTTISTTSGAATDATKGGTLAGVAMDAAGDAIVAWIPAGTTTYPRQIAYARRPASTGTFTTPADVSAGQDARRFGGLAMSPSGRAAIEFEWRADCSCMGSVDTPSETQHVQVARAAPGASFGAPDTVSGDVSAGLTSGHVPSGVAIDDAGDTVAGWADSPSPGSFTSEAATIDSGSSTWSAVTTFGTTDGSLGAPSVAIGPSGEATAIWDASSTQTLSSQSRPHGGVWSSATSIATADDWTLTANSNSTGPSGHFLAAFGLAGSGTTEAMSGALRPPGGAFSTSSIGTSGNNYQGGIGAAIDNAGDVGAAVWQDDDGVKVALYPPVSTPPTTTPPTTTPPTTTPPTTTPPTTTPPTTTPPTTTPPTTSPPPGGKLVVGKATNNKKKGTATLVVTVPGAGTLRLTGKGIKSVTKKVTKPGKVTLLVTPTGSLKKKLRKSGKALVKVKIAFSPKSGAVLSAPKSLTLVQKH